MLKVVNFDDFKIGDDLVLYSKPRYWTSAIGKYDELLDCRDYIDRCGYFIGRITLKEIEDDGLNILLEKEGIAYGLHFENDEKINYEISKIKTNVWDELEENLNKLEDELERKESQRILSNT